MLRVIAASVAIALVPIVVGCGSAGAASTTVPGTAGLSAERAMDALCASGVKVTVNQTVVQSTGPSARKRALTEISVTGTTPPAGHSVAKGAVVVLHETSPEGVELLFSTQANCLAPVFQTTTISTADQAAISAVANAPASQAIAAQFPSTAEDKRCVVVRPTPAPPARIRATCATFVQGGPGLEIVSFTEGWGGPNARRDDGFHTWNLLVQPHHAVEPGGSLGNPPRPVVG